MARPPSRPWMRSLVSIWGSSNFFFSTGAGVVKRVDPGGAGVSSAGNSGGGGGAANWPGAGAESGGSSLSAKLRDGAAASAIPDIMGSTLNFGAGAGAAEARMDGCAPAAAAAAFRGADFAEDVLPAASRSNILSSKVSSEVSPLDVLSSLAAKGDDFGTAAAASVACGAVGFVVTGVFRAWSVAAC